MRTILVVQEENPVCEAIIKQQFKEEIATGKTELVFIKPEELTEAWMIRYKQWFCVKSLYEGIRIFAVNMEPGGPYPGSYFSAVALQKISELRLQFRHKKVIIGFNSAAMSAPDQRHQPDIVCNALNLKSQLDSHYGWIK